MSAVQIAGQNLANQVQAQTEQQRFAAQKDLGMAQMLTSGSPNFSKGGQNISQDGAKVNYFGKTQGMSAEGGSEYSQNPVAIASVWGDGMARSDLIKRVTANGNPGYYGPSERA